MKICGRLVDIHKRDIYQAEIFISAGKIKSIKRVNSGPNDFILPGLIDAHVHIESSMITPDAFGYEVVKHGTVGVVSDPHEIANVLGWKGVEYMIRDAKKSPVRFWFGAPSCVPATDFETSGGSIIGDQISEIMNRSDIKYLSEMMNFPGVILGDREVLKKIRAAKRVGKPVDGHAPGLTGANLRKYVKAGITTDHECSSIQEAMEKISLGMKILIREGSAARNLDALKDLFNTYPEMIMLCSDDLHPEMLSTGHINKLIGRLIVEGYDIYNVVRSATVNPVNHYKLDSGLLKADDSADLILVGSLEKMDVKETWIKGKKVFSKGVRNFKYIPGKSVNRFNCSPIVQNDIKVKGGNENMRVIQAFDGKLTTKEIRIKAPSGDEVKSNTEEDFLKIVVKDRYRDSPPAYGFIKGFGLKDGAFAGTIAHDSHNIICVGTNDNDITTAVNELVKIKGGLVVSVNGMTTQMKLNIGGIMTTRSCSEASLEYLRLNEMVQALGCCMTAPFMTLSFMALLVIPDLKIGDRGLFDVNLFKAVPLFIDEESRNNIL
jgi:adenine deaminase